MYCANCNCEECIRKNFVRTMIQNGLKQCTKCKLVKKLDLFDYRDKKKYPNARRGDCKLCRRVYNAQFFKKNQLSNKTEHKNQN